MERGERFLVLRVDDLIDIRLLGVATELLLFTLLCWSWRSGVGFVLLEILVYL